MKHLIIYSHPNSKSFCHAILDKVEEVLAAKKHDIVVRDLYALGFDPVLKAGDLADFQLYCLVGHHDHHSSGVVDGPAGHDERIY